MNLYLIDESLNLYSWVLSLSFACFAMKGNPGNDELESPALVLL